MSASEWILVFGLSISLFFGVLKGLRVLDGRIKKIGDAIEKLNDCHKLNFDRITQLKQRVHALEFVRAETRRKS